MSPCLPLRSVSGRAGLGPGCLVLSTVARQGGPAEETCACCWGPARARGSVHGPGPRDPGTPDPEHTRAVRGAGRRVAAQVRYYVLFPRREESAFQGDRKQEARVSVMMTFIAGGGPSRIWVIGVPCSQPVTTLLFISLFLNYIPFQLTLKGMISRFKTILFFNNNFSINCTVLVRFRCTPAGFRKAAHFPLRSLLIGAPGDPRALPRWS